MADNTQRMMANQAGEEAKGQAQERASQMSDKTSNAAQSARDSIRVTGQQMKKAKAHKEQLRMQQE